MFSFKMLKHHGLLDIEPIKLSPTWWNKRLGNDRDKRLENFIFSKRIINGHIHIRKWVGFGNEFDHFPFFLENSN
jgi:hypothetical protein